MDMTLVDSRRTVQKRPANKKQACVIPPLYIFVFYVLTQNIVVRQKEKNKILKLCFVFWCSWRRSLTKHILISKAVFFAIVCGIWRGWFGEIQDAHFVGHSIFNVICENDNNICKGICCVFHMFYFFLYFVNFVWICNYYSKLIFCWFLYGFEEHAIILTQVCSLHIIFFQPYV